VTALLGSRHGYAETRLGRTIPQGKSHMRQEVSNSHVADCRKNRREASPAVVDLHGTGSVATGKTGVVRPPKVLAFENPVLGDGLQRPCL